MRQDDGEYPAIKPDADEQQQERQAGDHLWHHQWRVNHAGKQCPPRKPPGPHKHKCRHGAKHGRDARTDDGDLNRHPCGIQKRLILQKLAIPFGRKPGPDRYKF